MTICAEWRVGGVLALVVVVVPYIMHYYLLENGVQKMYRQYDEMYKRARAQSNPPQK